MAVIGTFGSFTAARLGIYASQASLNLTGNNIANINTEGYTRQRADLVSLYSYGSVRYANSYHKNIGYGVLMNTVSQLRDPFLDIRFREENSSSGAYEAKLDCLQQLSQILDEVGKGTDDFGVVAAQFEDFLSQLNFLLTKVGSVEYDTTVRGSAQTLTRLLNDYSKAMDTLGANKLAELKEDVKTVNSLLTQIRDLNVQIRDAGIAGDNALELRDARNLCIDKLSSYMKIDVSYDFEKIDEWNEVERLNITIAGSNPPIKLIQGIYGAQISMPEMAARRNPLYDPENGASYQYIRQDSDLANGIIYYTNSAREALKTKDGKTALTNDATALEAALKEAGYGDDNAVAEFIKQYKADGREANSKYAPYLKDDGTGTWDASEAEEVPNALEGDASNRLWMTVEALKDAKGRYMRDENHKEIKESVDLSDNQLYGSLQSIREFLTEKGEFSSDDDLAFDKFAAQKRGLPYYQNALDALARKFAEAFNRANQLNFGDVRDAYKLSDDGTYFVDRDGNQIQIEDEDGNLVDFLDPDGNPIGPDYFDKLAEKMDELEKLRKNAAKGQSKDGDADKIKQLEQDIEQGYKDLEVLRNMGELTDRWSFYNGGVLFSSNGDTNDASNITAGNITISKDWSTGDVRLLNTKAADDLDHSTANDNIYHMIELMSEDMNYFPNEVVDGAMNGGIKRYFTGSFAERLADMSSILGEETYTTGMLYNEYTATTLSLENSRQSVSGVDLNDEATNMMVFQKAYAAACQLMTTLDSMLDKLINGTLR